MSEAIPYSVRRSTRARRVRVQVDPERGVEVVLPQRSPMRAAEDAVRELTPWIEQRLAELEAQRTHRDGWLPYLDERLELQPQAGRTRAHRQDNTLLIPAGDPTEAIERWYRRAARSEIAPRLDRATIAIGRSYTRLTIRNQRTRWASCSTSGAMSFNWRLLLAPEHVLDYVVWHEACHLQQANHSPQFWALVASVCPDYQHSAKWLRAHSTQLRI